MRFLIEQIKGDRVVWLVAFFLGLISLIAVYGSTVSLAMKAHEGNTEYYLFRQCIIIITGFVLMYYVHQLRFRYYSRISQIAIWVSGGLLLLTLFMGNEINSASRWLNIPIVNQSFQTSDLAKIALVVFVARMLAQRQDRIESFKEGVLPILLPVSIICLLILPANFSTAAVLFATCFFLMFIGRVRILHLGAIMGSIIALVGLLLLVSFAKPDGFSFLPRLNTWKARVSIFFSDSDKEKLTPVQREKLEESQFQINQAKMAIATGGVFPKGPSAASSRNSLPHPYSDMIYAYIIQAYGSILGGIGVLMMYLILMFRAIRISIKCPSKFGSFAAVGLGFLLVFQALINMAVAVNILPVTGQPLPLISMGGTSTLLTCVALGIIISISKEDVKPKKQRKKQKGYAVA